MTVHWTMRPRRGTSTSFAPCSFRPTRPAPSRLPMADLHFSLHLTFQSYAMEESEKASATTAFKEARKAWKASLSDEMVTRIKQEGTTEHPSAIQIKRYNALKGVAKLSEWSGLG